jgi:AbrB family looped-hinge helix DNA binding protein
MVLTWYASTMLVSIDSAGRVVIPKPLRDQLGVSQATPLEIDLVDGHLELSVPYNAPEVIEGSYGPSFASTGTPITDAELRGVLEAVREHR